MKRFIEGVDRNQATLFPERLDDYVGDDNPVRAIDAFVDALDLGALGFDIVPEATGRPGYRPATMLKSMSMVISIRSNPRAAWNANAVAMSN